MNNPFNLGYKQIKLTFLSKYLKLHGLAGNYFIRVEHRKLNPSHNGSSSELWFSPQQKCAYLDIDFPVSIIHSSSFSNFSCRFLNPSYFFPIWNIVPSDLQLPLRQWGIGNVYHLVLSKGKMYLNIAENPITIMGL